MGKTGFELNREGVRELMLSEAMQAGLESIAQKAVMQLGDGYSMNAYRGKNRINVEVTADTFQARFENATSNTILKAVQG
jgi:hypothetical protein